MNVLVLMLGTVATWVLHAWFGRGWWLNSGAAVREVMLGLAVLGALAGTTIPEVNIRGSQFMVRAFYLWLGVLLALFIAFVRMGGFSGSIFPIVLAFMVVMSGVAVAVGYSVGLGARMSIRRLLAHKA